MVDSCHSLNYYKSQLCDNFSSAVYPNIVVIMHKCSWQVPITVHFDHGTSKEDLVEALELVG